MKKINKKTIVLLAAAAVLLIASAAGSTRAALTYYSENYSAEVTVSNIGVTLMENDEAISYRNYIGDGKWDDVRGKLFENMLAEDESLVLGKEYEEALSVHNSGAIDSYVRVILTKNWVDADGKVDQTLDPAIIELDLVTGSNGWVIDEEASTPERTVLYYTEILPVDESTSDFTSALSINPVIGTKVIETVETTETGKTITFEYEFDGYTFNVEAEVDAVQTHNASDAIKSAWGIDVDVAADGSISLQQEVQDI